MKTLDETIDKIASNLTNWMDPKTAPDEVKQGIRTGLQKRPRFITVYEVTRHYGGPEEGGWWWNMVECIKTKAIPHCEESDLQIVCRSLTEQLWAELSDDIQGDIYSVNGGTALQFSLEYYCKDNERLSAPRWEQIRKSGHTFV